MEHELAKARNQVETCIFLVCAPCSWANRVPNALEPPVEIVSERLAAAPPIRGSSFR